MNQPDPSQNHRRPEPEFEGPIWKHPYLLYVILTGVLFVFLVLMAYLAVSNGWLPTR